MKSPSPITDMAGWRDKQLARLLATHAKLSASYDHHKVFVDRRKAELSQLDEAIALLMKQNADADGTNLQEPVLDEGDRQGTDRR